MNPFTTRMNRSQFAITVALTPFMLLLTVSFIITGDYFTVIGFGFLLYMLTFPARRLNDLGRSPLLWLYLPVFLFFQLPAPAYIFEQYTLILGIFLLVVKGDPLPNKRGPVPSGFWFNFILFGIPRKNATSTHTDTSQIEKSE